MNNFFSPHSVRVHLLVPVGPPLLAAADSRGLPSSRQFPEWEILQVVIPPPFNWAGRWENSARAAEAKSAKNMAQ